MDQNAEWARANVPEVSNLSDSELSAISRNAWRFYQNRQGVVFGIAFFLYFWKVDEQLVRTLFEAPSFWHHLIIAMILGGVFGALLILFFRPLVRRRIRAKIGEKLAA